MGAVLAGTASVVQLVTAPYPLEVRLALFGLLLVMSVILLSYTLGFSRGSLSAATTTVPAGVSLESLLGQRFVKVASESRNAALCELRDDGVMYESWLPRSLETSRDKEVLLRGNWLLEGEELRIVTRGYNLGLRPAENGVWDGSEQYAEDSQPFVGGIIDVAAVRNGEAWAGLKLGEDGVVRAVVAEPDGRLRERDPFGVDPQSQWEGEWSIDGGRLRVSVGQWKLEAARWRPGVYIGSEESATDPDQGFAVVRLRVE